MTAIPMEDKIKNRRIASRVYEQANLFYRKVDRNKADRSSAEFDGLLPNLDAAAPASERSLPPSQARENDTLNVNISASGIAFTCKDELMPGDYLLLRILLLSSMTVVMTGCKVIYCRPSNPYEPGRYPYAVGAMFVNMTPADTALLHNHVNRRRKQQWWCNGALGALLAVVLAVPDQAFALLLGLGHHLIEIVLHLLHLGFEYLEMGLDHIIEHQFHTGMHETQIIVFYIIVSMGVLVAYLLGRKVPGVWRRWQNSLLLFLSRKKSSLLYFWNDQSPLDKVKIAGLSSVAVSAYVYFWLL